MGRVFFNTRKNVHSLTADYQALASDSGKIFFINVATGMTLTLPSVADAQEGWNCEVVIETNVSSNGFNITEKASADTDVIVLQTVEQDVTGSAVPAGVSTGCTTVALAHGADAIGDSFTIVCSGSKFFVKANVKADAAVTAS